MNSEIYILGGARTPMAEYAGKLKDISALELGAIASRAALQRTGVKPDAVDHVVFGNVLQTSSDAVYGARHVGLRAGLPIEVPALTVNRLCGSGIQAAVNGAHLLMFGEAEDEYAIRSQKCADDAWRSGRLKEEVVPVELKSRKGTELFSQDDHMRPDTTMEGLAKLPAAFSKNGCVTAGNASGIVDGGAALLLASENGVKKHGLAPLARLTHWAYVGVEPTLMGMGPSPATRLVLEKAKLTLKDIDLIEVNEAFAAQYLAVEKELGLDREKVNVNGGAIALGHPLGASGARLLLTLTH